MAEQVNENATETMNVIYTWNKPLHAAVEAGLEDITDVWPQSDPQLRPGSARYPQTFPALKPKWPKWDRRLDDLVEAGLDTTNLDIVKVVMIISYLLTFVVGFTGNTLVLYVIGRFPVIRRKSVANYYIWNLALADDLYVLTLPLFCWATYRSVGQWRRERGQLAPSFQFWDWPPLGHT